MQKRKSYAIVLKTNRMKLPPKRKGRDLYVLASSNWKLFKAFLLSIASIPEG